jgi:hypothetical protein
MKAPPWFASSVMGRLSAGFPGFQVSAATVQVYWDVLKDLPRAELEKATIAYLASETAWPVPARLRKLAQQAGDDEQMTAAEAWAEMYRNRHDRRHDPRWSSPAVKRAAEAVGWQDPNWLTEQMPTIRAQFERYYLAAVAKAGQQQIQLQAQHLLELAGGDQRGGEPRPLIAEKAGR